MPLALLSARTLAFACLALMAFRLGKARLCIRTCCCWGPHAARREARDARREARGHQARDARREAPRVRREQARPRARREREARGASTRPTKVTQAPKSDSGSPGMLCHKKNLGANSILKACSARLAARLPLSLTHAFDPQENRHTEPPNLYFDIIRCLESA